MRLSHPLLASDCVASIYPPCIYLAYIHLAYIHKTTPRLWRTHSCVQRSHSCEREVFEGQLERDRPLYWRGLHWELSWTPTGRVHTSVNAARMSACATMAW
jgi:hypothetical protein